MKKIPHLLTVLLAAGFLSACSFSLAEDIKPPADYRAPVIATQAEQSFLPAAAPDVEKGETLYIENCIRCHGETGMGDGEVAAELQFPPSRLGDPELARAATAASWYEVVTNGRLDRLMPPFVSLNDQERWDVVAYALSLSTPAENMAEAAKYFEQECADCHGPMGTGAGTVVALANPANTADQTPEEFFTIISEGSSEMPGYQDTLSEEKRWDLAEYSRSLMFAGQGDEAIAAATSEPTLTSESTDTPEISAAEEITATEGITLTAEMTPTGTLGGQLVKASSVEIPAGQVVTIHAFDNMAIAETYTTTVGSDGNFSAGEVEMPANRIFLASTELDGVTYTSDIATVSQGTTEIALPIQVFGTSTDTSMLSVDRMHIFLDFPTEGVVRVVELYLITNPTDRTIVAEEEGLPVITFHLPGGATNLQFQDSTIGQRYLEVPGGFGDTMQIAPGSGQHQVLFAYEMPFTRKVDLRIAQTLPVKAVTVLLPEDGVKVRSSQLEDGGTRDVQGTQYRMYNGSGLNPGDVLDFSLVQSGINTNLVIGLAAFGGVLLLAGMVMYVYNRNQGELEQAPAYEENAENLMDAIIALDDSYKTGALSEEAYRTRRTELKDKLKRLQDDRS